MVTAPELVSEPVPVMFNVEFSVLPSLLRLSPAVVREPLFWIVNTPLVLLWPTEVAPVVVKLPPVSITIFPCDVSVAIELPAPVRVRAVLPVAVSVPLEPLRTPPKAPPPDTVRAVGPLRAKVDPEPFRLARVWVALLKVSAPLSFTAEELESSAGEETLKAALPLTVTLPATVPVLIVLPVPLTVMPPVVRVPVLLKVLLPASVTAPTVPVPARVALVLSASLPPVPLTVRPELLFCVIAPVTMPVLIVLPVPLTVMPPVVSVAVLLKVLLPASVTARRCRFRPGSRWY